MSDFPAPAVSPGGTVGPASGVRGPKTPPRPLTGPRRTVTNDRMVALSHAEKPSMSGPLVLPRAVRRPAADTSADAPLQTGPLVIVGGCGHVGLPLGLAFARKGYAVDLLDASPERVATVNAGRMPFQEEGADALLAETVRAGLVRATTDPAVLEDAAAVIVTIGTPVDECLDPSVGAFDRAMNDLLDRVRPGQLLVLRSTLFPGVTDRLARQLERR